MNISDQIISSLSLAKRMKYKPKTTLPEVVKSMFTYHEIIRQLEQEIEYFVFTFKYNDAKNKKL